jgi:hypothetical protein
VSQVRWTQRSYPYRQPGLGIALLTFCALAMVWLFKACFIVAKWTVVLVATGVAMLAGWIRERRVG